MRTHPHLTAALVVAAAMASATSAAASTMSTGPAVQPNPDEQTLARTTHVVIRGAPSPVAQPNPDEQGAIGAAQNAGPHSEVIDNRGYGPSNTPGTIVRVTTPAGFDWGDAGIGAVAGLALSMLGVGLFLLASPRRTGRTGSTATTH